MASAFLSLGKFFKLFYSNYGYVQPQKKKIRTAISLFYFLQGFCFASWASRIDIITHQLHISDAALGSILLAIPIGQICTLPFSQWAVRKFKSKNTEPIAISLYAFTLLSISFVSSAVQLAVCLFFFGVFANIGNISVNTQGINAERMYHRPIMSSFHGLWSLAGCTGALMAILVRHYNISTFYHFFISASITWIITFFARKLLLDDFSPVKPSNKAEKKNFFKTLKDNSLLLKLGLICAFAMACEGAMFDWSGKYFRDVVHAKGGTILLGYFVFMFTMTLGRLIGDRLVIAFGRKKLLRINGLLIMTGLLIAIIFPHVITAAIGFMI